MARSRASAKKAGTQFETDCALYLTDILKRKVTRMPKTGALDKGDLYGVEIHGVPMVGECKSPGQKSSWSLSGWWKEAEAEMDNVMTQYGVLIIKRFRKSTQDAFCVVDNSMWERIHGDKYCVPFACQSLSHGQWGEYVDKHTVFSTPQRGKEGTWVITNLKTFSEIIYGERYIPTVNISRGDIDALLQGDSVVVFDDRGVEIILSVRSTS